MLVVVHTVIEPDSPEGMQHNTAGADQLVLEPDLDGEGVEKGVIQNGGFYQYPFFFAHSNSAPGEMALGNEEFTVTYPINFPFNTIAGG